MYITFPIAINFSWINMSINQFSLRKLSFPTSSDMLQLVTTNYMAYLLDYSTTIKLFNDVENPDITRTFKPKEFFLASEITDTDITSINYNVPVIDKYVTNNIFTKIPVITTISVPSGVSNPVTDYTISTIGTMITSNSGSPWTEIRQEPFVRGNTVYWMELSNTGEIDALDVLTPKFMDFSTEVMGYGAWEFHYDGSASGINHSNLVIDSSGTPWVATWEVGETLLYTYYISSFDINSNILSIASVDRYEILPPNVPGGSIVNLLIDENDVKYIVTSTHTEVSGVYQIAPDNTGMTFLFGSPALASFQHARYNIADTSFIIWSDDGTIIKYSNLGGVVTTQTLSGSITPSMMGFSTGATLAEALVVSSDGPEIFLIGPYLSGDGSEYASASVLLHYTPEGFVDGAAGVGQISATPLPSTFPVKYDTRNTDIYFIDMLALGLP